MNLSSEKLKTSLASLSSAVIITDKEGYIEWVNKGFTAMTGYDLNTIIGLKPGAFLQGPKTDPSTVAEISTALRNQETFNVDILNYHKDGQEVWINLICDPLFDDDGNCFGFIGIQPNITEQKKKEIAERRESFEMMQGIFNKSAYAMLLADDTMKYKNVNDAAQKLLGYTKEEMLGFSVTDLIDQKLHANAEHLWSDLMSKSNQAGRIYLKHKNGTPVLVEYMATKDVVSGVHLSILLDVEARDKHEREIEEKNKQLEAMNKEKLLVLSILAHDLADPIQNLGGMLTLLRRKELSEQEFDAFIGQLDNAFTFTKDFLKNLVSWANNQIHGIKVNRKEVELNAIIDYQVTRYQSLVTSKNIKIHAQMDQDLVIQTDEHILDLVLRNLISNAIKFCRNGDEILLRVAKEEEYALISVIDTGFGIQPKDIDSIFDINFSKGQKSNPTGYGLGLNMCKDFLGVMGEEIWVESEPEKGTSFLFTLHYE